MRPSRRNSRTVYVDIRHRWFPLLCLLAIVSFLWREMLSGSRILDFWSVPNIPAEAPSTNFPLFQFFAIQLQRRVFPLWCPLIFAGFPMCASQIGIFYPIHLAAAYLFPPLLAFNLSLFSGYAIGGAAMYAYARKLELDPWSAVFSGVAFVSAGFFVGQLPHQNLIKAVGWLPLAMLAGEGLEDASWRRSVLLGGLAFGMQWLAAAPQAAYYSTLAVGIAWFADGMARAKGAGLAARARALGKTAPRLCLMVLIGAGLGAAQILPMLASYRWSAYKTVDILRLRAFHFQWIDLRCLFLLEPHRHAPEFDIFAGFTVLLMAALGFADSWRNSARRSSAFALGALGLAGVLATFAGTQVLGRAIPGFGFFRFSQRFFLLTHFSLCVWAGMGIHWLQPRVRKILKGIPWAAAVLAIGLLAAESRRHIADRMFVTAQEDLECTQALAAPARDLMGSGRLLSFHPYYLGIDVFQTLDFPNPHAIFWHNLNIPCGLRSISGAESLEPGRLGAFRQEMRRHQGELSENVAHPDAWWVRLAALQGVGVVASQWRIEAPGLKQAADVSDMKTAREAYLYRVVAPAPAPEMLTHEAFVADTPQAAFAIMSAKSYDPSRQTVVAGDPGPLGPRTSPETIVPQIAGFNHLRYDVSLSAPGLLVVRNLYLPDWRAWVDGNKQDILPADVAFMAVRLSAGNHRVEFKLQSPALRWGLIITLATLAAILFSFCL